MHARKRQGLRVLIADNNAMTRHLLARALEQDSEFHVTECEFASPALTEAVQQAMPDILLVASGNNDSVEPVIAASLQIPWILLLNHDDEEHIVAAFRSGAQGIFLCSEPDLKLLRKCVRCVSKGQIWAASSQLKQVLAALPALQGPDVSRKLSSLRPLTRREQEVVSYVAEGLNNRDIAAAMNLRENTIKNYVFRVYEKLGLCNRVELTRYAMQRQARSS